ncbi:MAG: class I SAM-dependent methyltransferase [archaeon]
MLEIGCGTGRIINNALDINKDLKIHGIEINPITHKFTQKRFSTNDNIEIYKTDINDYLKQNEHHYDLTACMMNTFGNIHSNKLFNKITEISDNFIFSLYNKKYDKDRQEIYLSRGHYDFNFDGKKYCFNDPWIKGLVSRSYTEDEIKKMVNDSNAKLVDIRPVGILHYVITRAK